MFNRAVIIVSPVKQQQQMHRARGVAEDMAGDKSGYFPFGIRTQQADVLRKGCACLLR